ncbi:MAG: histidine kinase [Sphingobacteriales bacterium]|nr:MAG: histidine kinase [Sphingobacteriales bacterium]
MKKYWKIITPGLFGLMVYTCIRLVNDTAAGEKFWTWPWQVYTEEIAATIVVSYLILWIVNRVIRYFEAAHSSSINNRTFFKEFGIMFLITLGINHLLILPIAIFIGNGMQLQDYVIANIVPTLFTLLFFTIKRGNQYLNNYIDEKVQVEKITNDKLQTELKFLKAQYHPHFLFNALNTIYFQMDENKAEAKHTIEKFSELLRYQLYDQQQTVPVSQEIHYLQNFIDIQRVRSSEKLQLDTNFDTALNGQQVYPLLFLPLAENAFKYVGGEYKIEISAAVKNNEIEFSVTNSLPQLPVPEKQNGIGLENLKRRLALLYPGRHELITQKANGSFKAILRINIHD